FSYQTVSMASFFFFKQKTAYEFSRDWSSDVCSSDLTTSISTNSLTTFPFVKATLKRQARERLYRLSTIKKGKKVIRSKTNIIINPVRNGLISILKVSISAPKYSRGKLITEESR